MHVFSRPAIREFIARHADAKVALESWYRIASKAAWHNLAEVQKSYSSAEAVGNFTVFNIKGNHYRLIVDIQYPKQAIYIKYILTHAEYDKDKWKNDPYF